MRKIKNENAKLAARLLRLALYVALAIWGAMSPVEGPTIWTPHVRAALASAACVLAVVAAYLTVSRWLASRRVNCMISELRPSDLDGGRW